MNTSTNTVDDPTAVLDEKALHLLHWRSRRGLLENDLFIEKFFEKHGPSLTYNQGEAMTTLMNLADNDLLDLVLRRKELEEAIETPALKEVLEMLRNSRSQT